MCEEGYVLRGPERMRCVAAGDIVNGRWAGFTPLCLRMSFLYFMCCL